MTKKDSNNHGSWVKPLYPIRPILKHDCGSDHKEKDNCCLNRKGIERQVNSRAADVANFPRITQSETSANLASYQDFILYGFNDSNDWTGVPGASSFSGFAFSSDLGNTWTDGGSLPVNPGGLNEGDPVIAVDRNGVFYYGQVGVELVGTPPVSQGVISVSTGTINPDRTITMNPPQVVGRGQNPVNQPASQDKEWITVGPDANSAGNEALYVAWADFTVGPNSTNIRFSKYTTGVNLTPIIQDRTIVVGNTNFVSGVFVVVDSRGTIYVFYEEISPRSGQNVLGQPNRTIRMVKSTDGGNSFPINVPVSLPFAASGTTISSTICNRPAIGVDNVREIRMNDFPHAAIGPDDTLYVVWNAGRVVGVTTFIDIFLAYSTDGGNTWNQVNITNDLSFSFFPSVAANKCGAHVQYNRFNDPNGVGGVGDGTFGVFMKTFSVHRGLSKEIMISNQFSPVPMTAPNPDPVPARCYMGDYNQIVAGPGNSLLHAYGDNRNVLNGQINPDVFFKRTVPIQRIYCNQRKDSHY